VTFTAASDWNGQEVITFTATDPGGLSDSDASIVTVTPVNDAPVASNDTYSVDEDDILNVAAPGVLDNDIDADGNPLTSVLATGVSNGILTLNADRSFTYTPNTNFAGTDSFTYLANDGSADSNVAIVTITVNPVNDAPVAVAGGPYSGDEGSTIVFNGSSSHDLDGTIVSYEWDFGDGATGSSDITNHAYKDNGYYTITLTVADDGGLEDTSTTNATVYNVPPIVNAINDGPKNEGTQITVTVSQEDPGISDTFTYSFDWDNDGTYEIVNQTTSSASHIWDQNGTYIVGIRVKDDDDGVGTTATEIIVTDIDPIASFSYSPTNPEVGDTVWFTDTSTSYDGIVSWNWTFGEGNSSTDRNSSHAYASAGEYTVTLTVEESDGDFNIDTATFTVTEAPALPNKMIINNINMALEIKGVNVKAMATVTILDGNDNLVKDATVYGHWSGLTTDEDIGTTNTEGEVILLSNRVKKPESGKYFNFTVDNVVYNNWIYDSDSNTETSDSISV
jgi:PKD repeat protein